MIFAIAVAASNVKGQAQEESPIKILPTIEPGVLLVLYALKTDEPLEVIFSNSSGMIDSDRIVGEYPKGLSKRYDVKCINEKDFWIQVTSSNVEATYHIVPSKDRKTFVPYLEKTTYKHMPLANNN
jgi:hypothetical protein